MKKSFIVIGIFILINGCLNAQKVLGKEIDQAKNKSLYVFSDAIKASMLEGIELTKKWEGLTLKKNYEGFYILISENSRCNGYSFTIGYCKNCSDFSPIINSTNRFCEIKKGLLLPIIFQFDLEFSSLFNKKNGEKLNFTVGGYTIITDYQGNILQRGLQQ